MLLKGEGINLYADDTQLYYSCKSDNVNETVKNINSDLSRISNFF